MSIASLRDGKGPVEMFLRKHLDRLGFDPYDVDLGELRAHARMVCRQRESRFWFRSPCWAFRSIDFTVHLVIPLCIAEQFPRTAAWLKRHSPRWAHVSIEHAVSATRRESSH